MKFNPFEGYSVKKYDAAAEELRKAKVKAETEESKISTAMDSRSLEDKMAENNIPGGAAAFRASQKVKGAQVKVDALFVKAREEADAEDAKRHPLDV
ncbi:MAG TPA: hypothetical protein VJJ22_02735 [Candidatus Paceibacterota bacterium]